MITYSGIHIQTIGGADGTPTALDIAVHSGRLCRFGGAVWEPLLTHLVFVGLLALRRSGSNVNMVAGFVHDGHECVTGDAPRPFKCDCMRAEQKALDERIYPRFIPFRREEIDHELIKTCDVDACHIEAIELGVQGFAAIETKHGSRNEIYYNEDDRQLFRRLLHTPFYEGTIGGQMSDGVLDFAEALRFAEKGDYRMPSIIEKLNLVEECCYENADV